MICKKCGIEIPNDALVCPSCGEKQFEDTHSEGDRTTDGKRKFSRLFFIIIAILMSVSLLAASAIIHFIPDKREYRDELASLIAVKGTSGEVAVIDTDSKKVILLDGKKDVKKLMLSENEDTLFFIAEDNGVDTLFSRYISSFIHKEQLIARDVSDYLISANAKRIAYKTSSGSLMWGRTDEEPMHIANNAGEYYLSRNGGMMVYTAARDGISSIYVFDGSESRLISEDAAVVELRDDLKTVFYKHTGGLYAYDIKEGIETCIAPTYTSILAIYEKPRSVYYTVSNRETGILTLMLYENGITTCISENLSRLEAAHETKPFIVFSEFYENTKLYKAVHGGRVDEAILFPGISLSDFSIIEETGSVIYLDKSATQSKLINASLGKDTITKLAVIDTDVRLICGINKEKPLYFKNFNTMTMTVTLCYNGEKIADDVMLRDATRLDTYIIYPNTLIHDNGEKPTPYYAALPLRSSEAFLFHDKHGHVSKFDGELVTHISEEQIHELYLISGDCIVYSTDSGLFINKNGKTVEIDIGFSEFLFIEPYGSKPYQLKK